MHRFDGSLEKEKTIPDLAREDAKDPQFIESAARAVLRYLVPEFKLPDDFYFRLINIEGQFAVDTNLDFQSINSTYRVRVPVEHSTITSAYVLSHIIDARADSFFAAYYMAELVTSPIYSDLIRLKHFEFLRRRGESLEQQAQFRDLVVPEFPTLRETINSGTRSFKEFLELLDRADKFKGWIQKANPDAGLIQSYHRAATEATWAEKIPSRSVRFVVATTLGLAAEAIAPSGIGAGLGLTVGAMDSLFLDRLIKGWRPNQFVTGPLTDFLRGPPRYS
ncbi:hypothetical protein ACNJYA_04810 [Bradyrhizobium sp. DASA03068]|uniref:hypothetical protein n=1 Tax=Bradyrhizobium sp. BLXBL-01 TaxID=3395915 RepID=UPI003F6FEEC4